MFNLIAAAEGNQGVLINLEINYIPAQFDRNLEKIKKFMINKKSLFAFDEKP